MSQPSVKKISPVGQGSSAYEHKIAIALDPNREVWRAIYSKKSRRRSR